MSELLQDLKAVRALIHKGWIQRSYASNGFGGIVVPSSPHATCFCLTGAVHRVRLSAYWDPLIRSLSDAIGVSEGAKSRYRFVLSFNDKRGRTKAEVIAILDTAVETEAVA